MPEQLVGDEALAKGLEDGNTAGNAGLEIDRHVGLLGQGNQLRSPFGQKGFISGDERLAGSDGRLGHLQGIRGTPEEFDHDLDSWVGNH